MHILTSASSPRCCSLGLTEEQAFLLSWPFPAAVTAPWIRNPRSLSICHVAVRANGCKPTGRYSPPSIKGFLERAVAGPTPPSRAGTASVRKLRRNQYQLVASCSASSSTTQISGSNRCSFASLASTAAGSAASHQIAKTGDQQAAHIHRRLARRDRKASISPRLFRERMKTAPASRAPRFMIAANPPS